MAALPRLVLLRKKFYEGLKIISKPFGAEDYLFGTFVKQGVTVIKQINLDHLTTRNIESPGKMCLIEGQASQTKFPHSVVFSTSSSNNILELYELKTGDSTKRLESMIKAAAGLAEIRKFCEDTGIATEVYWETILNNYPRLDFETIKEGIQEISVIIPNVE
jgi:hypothetical protein